MNICRALDFEHWIVHSYTEQKVTFAIEICNNTEISVKIYS